MEEKDFVTLHFSHTDEWDNTTELSQKIMIANDGWNIENMLDEYKRFLLACGYGQCLIDRIKYVEEGEQQYEHCN